MIKVKEYNNEFEVLQKINMMNEDELKQYRLRNKEHNEKIQRRTVRNFISETIKRCIDILAGIDWYNNINTTNNISMDNEQNKQRRRTNIL